MVKKLTTISSCKKLFSLFFLLFTFVLNAEAQQHLYWSDTTDKKIYKADVDGSNKSAILTFGVSEQAQSITIDDVAEKIFWIDPTQNLIIRSNLDGTTKETILSSFNGSVTSLTVDAVAGKIYWTDGYGVNRSNIDGTSQQFALYAPSMTESVSHLAFDGVAHSIFFMETFSTLNFLKSLDTTNPVSANTMTVGDGVTALAANPAGTEIIWANTGTPKEIRSFMYGGSSPETLYSLSAPISIHDGAMDYPETNFYYADDQNDTIVKLNVTTLASQNIPSSAAPYGVALDCGRYAKDTDADGTVDCKESCDSDPLKTVAGVCGCGTADTDTDSDGTANCIDACPSDSAKIAAGTCGCGVADSDTDSDLTLDCNDGCPSDARKIAPGTCGCGQVEDVDDAGKLDCNPFRTVRPNTKISAPPQVEVTGRSVTIVLEKFTGASLKPVKPKDSSFALFDASEVFIEAAKKKVSITYEIELQKSGSKKKDIQKKTSKRNEYTFKNLKAGTYSVRYRVTLTEKGKSPKQTKYSPKATFNVT